MKAAAELEEVLRGEGALPFQNGLHVAVVSPPTANFSTPIRPVSSPDAKPKDRTPIRNRPVNLFDQEALFSTSLLLECANCRNPCSASTAERQSIEKDNKRRLRQLGRNLYRISRGLSR
ncbi:unnamed protein product [Phytomonas sp. Hart1]|nr:unnamed protein product [Phytomonas sp. Hart1]|eukprot:CCW70403.1 unnamed protein product [Phytomonas sp. isolate Hart1]